MNNNLPDDLDSSVLKAQGGDNEAFGKIYDLLVKPVYRYIFYRVDNSAAAEDISEETFFKAWKHLQSYKKGEQPFTAWLFRIAHNLVVDYYRRHKTAEMIDEAIPDEKQDSDPRGRLNLKLTQIRLRKLIRRLPNAYREVIILKYINEFDNKEIARMLDKSEGAVRTLQFRALEQLRSLIDGRREDF